MEYQPIGNPRKSALKCPAHKTMLQYWHKGSTYYHYYCKSGDHWVDIPLDKRDEVK